MAMQQLIAQYLAQLHAIQLTGAAQPEQSYYPALQTFLAQAAAALGHGNVQVIPQPQHQDYGVPDFQVQQSHTIIGWAEAKSLSGALNPNTQQLRQYRSALHNLLLTNYLRFRLFINGQEERDVTLTADLTTPPTSETIAQLEQLLHLFFAQSVPAIQSAAQLADALALRARFLRHAVSELFGAQSPPLVSLHNAYRQYLYPDISNDDFFDLVAQTIVYALFAAWSQTPEGAFSLNTAATHLPANVPLLQNLFALTVTNPALQNTPIGLHVSGVVSLLSQTSPQILHVSPNTALQDDVGQDPVMYFYEPFLHAYSPRTAEARGVYYTPLPAVRAMVRIADAVARTFFTREKGLADQNVFLLDPATGTGTFLAQVARQIKENVEAAGDTSLLPQYLHQRFVANSYGFEFLAAPYTIAHLKLTRILQDECGLTLLPNERLKVYLTNTLQMEHITAPALPYLEELAAETHAAAAVKMEQPLLVVIGNPPWSGHSENLDVTLDGVDIVEPFKWCDGAKVEQTKWLNNDYVKFLRWAQWRVAQAPAQVGNGRCAVPDALPAGVVVLITDSSYLASPTFRGMRRFLLTQFDDIYIINLHGNIRSGGGGASDENIFDIQQGVCIGVFVRHNANGENTTPTNEPQSVASLPDAVESPFLTLSAPPVPQRRPRRGDVRVAQLSTAPMCACVRYLSSGTGSRADKYTWLNALTWEQLQNAPPLRPEPPFYFLKPFETDAEYWSWLSLKDIRRYFELNVLGVDTHRNDFAVAFTSAELRQRLLDFADLNLTDEQAAQLAKVQDTGDWSVRECRQHLQQGFSQASIRPYAYRPFDVRWVYHHQAVCDRPRHEVMNHLYQPNVALVAVNNVRSSAPYRYALVSCDVLDSDLLSTEAGCYAFPLYRYESGVQQTLTNLGQDNIRAEVLGQLNAAYGSAVTGEEAFYYTYAVLNAQDYRQTYEEQLRVDFPHVPFPKDAAHFKSLAALGRELAEAHLQRALANLTISFHSAGGDVIEANAVTYVSAMQSVQFNSAGARFAGITQEMWDYHIGSYRPLERWLKERNGRRFVLDYSPDPTNEVRIDDYRHIARAIAAALPVHAQINAVWQAMIADASCDRMRCGGDDADVGGET